MRKSTESHAGLQLWWVAAEGVNAAAPDHRTLAAWREPWTLPTDFAEHHVTLWVVGQGGDSAPGNAAVRRSASQVQTALGGP